MYSIIANVIYVIIETKQYRTRQDWVGKVIHWELCKKLKFGLANKWYIKNPESVRENKTHKVLWHFEIQNGSPNLDQTTRTNYSQKKKKKKKIKKNLPNCGFCCPCWLQSEIERKQKENWKNCGTWKWRWYQLWFEASVQSSNDWYRESRIWK